MKTLAIVMGILLMLSGSEPLFATDLASLIDEGYQVVDETKVVGLFEGCDARRSLTFTNGKVFVCTTYAFSFAAYMPFAYILEDKSKNIKVLINGNAYSGSFVEQEKEPGSIP